MILTPVIIHFSRVLNQFNLRIELLSVCFKSNIEGGSFLRIITKQDWGGIIDKAWSIDINFLGVLHWHKHKEKIKFYKGNDDNTEGYKAKQYFHIGRF